MSHKKILFKEKKYKNYIMKRYKYPTHDVVLDEYFTYNCDYIGNKEYAEYICDKLGIYPEKRTITSNICSIGYSGKDGKWYGWSHRAIHGFKIGDKIKKGDCAFIASNEEEFKEQSINFYKIGETNTDVRINSIGTDYGKYVEIIYEHGENIPNKNLRGKTSIGNRIYYPKNWGRGEWEAKTTNDAKQMAKDFAESVS